MQPVLLVPQDQQEQQVLQEILVRLGLQARPEIPALPDLKALQALRAQRETQAQQDLLVLQETRERLDRLVQ